MLLRPNPELQYDVVLSAVSASLREETVSRGAAEGAEEELHIVSWCASHPGMEAQLRIS